LGEMQTLLDRGARRFKFVDRTFNLNMRVSRRILEFFLERYTPDMFLHFEMFPDRLPESIRDVISEFPAGAMQFEVGVQTLNPDVSRLISRNQDVDRLEGNLRFLREDTGVHIHADLIVGLPGETIESFAEGFDRLVAMDPQEIQVGILKRLRGTPIIRHDDDRGMVYRSDPPYDILQNNLISATTMGRFRRFARFWDMIPNSGNFVSTTPLIWGRDSPFAEFMALGDWLYQSEGRAYGISLIRLAELLFEYLIDVRGVEVEVVVQSILDDYHRGGRSDMPRFLRPYLAELERV
ncbi:MAG: DUF4080 domain-containing protein, partial [Planctomycetota bacterium]|nr:DUF4080 domain-containing protein [Planctomycetota bacterium]